MAADPHLTAQLVDGAGVTVRVERAWPVVALRPARLRWCRRCEHQDCAISSHVSLTFTASQCKDDGSWIYRTNERWPKAAMPTGRKMAIIDKSGAVIAEAHGQAPWPDPWMRDGVPYRLWCCDAQGVVLYRAED